MREPDYVIGAAVDNRLDECRDIPGIMGAVGVDKNEDITAGVGDADAQGITFAFAVIQQDGRVQFGGDVPCIIAAVAVDDQQFVGIRRGPFQDRSDVAALIAAGHDYRDPNRAPIRPPAGDGSRPVGLGIPVGQNISHRSSQENRWTPGPAFCGRMLARRNSVLSIKLRLFLNRYLSLL